MSDLYIDNAARKRIVTFWIPVCLGFLHLWATKFAIALVIPAKYTDFKPSQLKAITDGFEICGWGIAALILLLISDKALEFVITRLSGGLTPVAQEIVKTTTEKTTVTPAVANPATPAQDVNISAENVNVAQNPD